MSLTNPVSSVLPCKSVVVYYVTPETPVYDALQIMADNEVGALLVMHDGQLQGVISERDYARKVILLGKSSKETNVGEIMGCWQLRIGLRESVDECMRIMTENRVRHLPVTEGATVWGVVSMGDLVKTVISEQEDAIAHLKAYVASGG